MTIEDIFHLIEIITVGVKTGIGCLFCLVAIAGLTGGHL